MNQKVDRPSLPGFAYGEGPVGRHTFLEGQWSLLVGGVCRTHPDKRDTEGDIVVLADGSLLLAWSDFYTTAGQRRLCRISMRRSSDGGRKRAIVPEWGSQNFNEPGIVELSDGRLWMYGRTTMGFHAQAWSADRGRTWLKPEPMALRGPCSPLTGETIPETGLYSARWAGPAIFCSRFPIMISRTARRKYRYTAARRWMPPFPATEPEPGPRCGQSRKIRGSNTATPV